MSILFAMQPKILRSTYAKIDDISFRLRAAGKLIGVTDSTMRTYADSTGIKVRRANEINPAAPAARIFSAQSLFDIAAWRRSNGNIKRFPDGARPQVITVYVAKGGTAKTTTAVETAIHLQLQGLRVLLIDLDFQANATALMGYESDLTTDDSQAYGVSADAIVERTFANCIIPFLRDAARTETYYEHEQVVKLPFGPNGPHLLPADTYLADAEAALSNARGQRELYIKRLLDASIANETPYFKINQYDVIIFDCAPSVNFLSSAAITASDFVIAPIRLDSFSLKGLNRLNSELRLFAREYGATPELVILPTHNSPQLARIGRMHAQLQIFRDNLAPISISSSEEFPKSLEAYMPLSLQKPTCNAASEYQQFAEFMRDKLVDKAHKEMKK